jgi:hypothetical protein
MVGSSFILTQRNGDKMLLNTAEVISIYTEDIDLRSSRGRYVYKQYPTAQGMLYTVQVMVTSRRDIEYIFAEAAARDALYEQLLSAIPPALVIDIAAPKVPQLVEEEGPERKMYTREEVFATREDFERAVAAVRVEMQQSPPVITKTPIDKPPRKPRTPRS